MSQKPLSSGLYIVSTPIGNLNDITLRALEVLKACNKIYCEDTRVSRKLLSAYGINVPLKAYHEHNADKVRPEVLSEIAQGQVVALISDAGTPLISDPGFKLVRACQEQGLFYTHIPGASASISALVLSGMPSDQFHFSGFAQPKKFQALQAIPGTLIFFESCHRLQETLEKMESIFLGRECCVVREITKLYEEVIKGSFEEVIAHYKAHPPKGECVIVLSPSVGLEESHEDLDSLIIHSLKNKSVKETSETIASLLGLRKKDVYKRCLELLSDEVHK